MRRIAIVVHNRANFARVKSVILNLLKNHQNVHTKVILASSSLIRNYGDLENDVRALNLDFSRVYNLVSGDRTLTMVKTTGLAMLDLCQEFENYHPDIVVSIADRHETLATVVAASYMNIPVAHIQGGEISGSIDESVRHACTKLSHLHFPATDRAARIIEQMGENKENIFNFGCPSLDLLKTEKIEEFVIKDLLKKNGGVGPELSISNGFLLVVQHPVTTHYQTAEFENQELLEAVKKISLPTVWLWPNVDTGSELISAHIRRAREKDPSLSIRFYTNFSPEDYGIILNASSCILGNSSSGIRESSFLGVPSVTLGDRQAGREKGDNTLTVEYRREDIVDAVQKQISNGRFPASNIYGKGLAGVKIAEVLANTSIKVEKRFSILNF